MESVHAKSYSSIFSTLNTKAEIEDIFNWTNSNEFIQRKASLINDIYKTGNQLEKKAASVLLESFLFLFGILRTALVSRQQQIAERGGDHQADLAR